MEIKQFYDQHLAHSSYAILSEGKVAIIDPARDPAPYEMFAKDHDASIAAIFETHPHADFVSSHLEIHEKYNAPIFVFSGMGVSYPHKMLEDGDVVEMGNVSFKALFTPGHSPDHLSFLLYNEEGGEEAVFTGDSLFIGDVGRPDLREGAGSMKAKREALAEMMYQTVHQVFRGLPDHVTVYPAHGAGSLCGKSMSNETTGTIGREKRNNWAMLGENKEAFIENLLDGQPMIPKYFPYNVELNLKGAPGFQESINEINVTDGRDRDKRALVIDAGLQESFRKGHIKNSINIPDTPDDRFETWLGTIVGPEEKFYLTADSPGRLKSAIRRSAKIGYDLCMTGAFVLKEHMWEEQTELVDTTDLQDNPERYTIVDVRDDSELETTGKLFDHALHIPLAELRERREEIPTDKPVAVHCSAGYRSSIATGLLERRLNKVPVLDIGPGIRLFERKSVKRDK